MQSNATRNTRTAIWAALACIGLLGCSSTEPNPSLLVQGVPTADSGAQVDGRYGPDAGGILPPDAGGSTDAGAVDDGASVEDAASAEDTGTTTDDSGGDAGGTDDAGGPSDTSVHDATTPDAGEPDVEPGSCVQNTDCADPATPFCVEGLCVQCLNSTQCSGGDQCLANVCTHEGCLADVECIDPNAPICFVGKCVECLGNAQCGPGGLCIDHACIECLEDEQCPEGQVCSQDHQCIAPECFTGSECADGQVCWTHECQEPPPCNVPADCAPLTGNFACFDGVCIPAECHEDGDCGGSTPHCTPPVQGGGPARCVECTDTWQCPEGSICNGNWTCVPSP